MTDSRTTAKLCKLLRERGVEYTTSDDERAYDEPAKTTWDFVLCGLEMTVTATEFVDVEGKTYLEMDFHHAFTPEQAIAATLGSDECEMEYIDTYEYADGEEDYLCKCSNCGRESWEPAHNLPEFCGGCGRAVKQ